MKIAICMLIVAGVIFGCAGPSRLRRPLYFESLAGPTGVKPDTADFIHVISKDEPLSLELMGRSDTLAGSSYRLFLQIGVYGVPGFDPQRLLLKPENLRVSANGLECPGATIAVYTNMRPWDANSIHLFRSDKDSLLATSGDSSMVHLKINLDGYAVNDGRPVVVQPIVAFDPWFNRWLNNKSPNR